MCPKQSIKPSQASVIADSIRVNNWKAATNILIICSWTVFCLFVCLLFTFLDRKINEFTPKWWRQSPRPPSWSFMYSESFLVGLYAQIWKDAKDILRKKHTGKLQGWVGQKGRTWNIIQINLSIKGRREENTYTNCLHNYEKLLEDHKG